MRVGDKILVVHGISDGGLRLDLCLARVTGYHFDGGKRRINYRLRGESGHPALLLYGRDEGLKWCRGWDLDSPAACALRVALALVM